MDQRHSIPAFHPGRLYQIGEDSWYLDAGGNWFLWDISSENWVLSGQAESAIPNSAALARHTANANAASATGYASGTSSFGGRPEPASMDQATGQPVYRGAHSTPQRLQTLLRNPMVDSVDDMNVVAIPANGALGTGRTIPSTIAVNGGSWDSMIEDNLPPRTDVRGEPHGRRPSDRNQLMDRDDRVNDFVRTQIRSGITTRNPYEAPHSLSLVDERILQDQRHGRSSRNPEYRYATNLTVSSDGSTSESETPNDRPKSVSKSQRERKSDKGSSSRRGRR